MLQGAGRSVEATAACQGIGRKYANTRLMEPLVGRSGFIPTYAPASGRRDESRPACRSLQKATSPNTPISLVFTFCTCGGSGVVTDLSPFSCFHTPASLKPLVTWYCRPTL